MLLIVLLLSSLFYILIIFFIRFAELEKTGVRWVYRGNNNTFANDIEPEYIAFNSDESKAYICLQVNFMNLSVLMMYIKYYWGNILILLCGLRDIRFESRLCRGHISRYDTVTDKSWYTKIGKKNALKSSLNT